MFAEALGRKDAAALRRLLQPKIDFRAMTPGRFWESDDSAIVVDDILLGAWFDASDEIEVISIEAATVADRERVGYRFRVRNADGLHIVDQQAYLAHDGDRISWLRMMCAGFLPVSADDAS